MTENLLLFLISAMCTVSAPRGRCSELVGALLISVTPPPRHVQIRKRNQERPLRERGRGVTMEVEDVEPDNVT